MRTNEAELSDVFNSIVIRIRSIQNVLTVAVREMRAVTKEENARVGRLHQELVALGVTVHIGGR